MNVLMRKSWDDAKNFLTQTFNDLRKRIQAMEPGELDRPLAYSDGTERPLWRGLGGQVGLHLSWHLGILLFRHGSASTAVEIEESVFSLSRDLGDDDAWKAVNHYDLACAYAQAGQEDNALKELKEHLL
jgi:hypothetical protein